MKESFEYWGLRIQEGESHAQDGRSMLCGLNQDTEQPRYTVQSVGLGHVW